MKERTIEAIEDHIEAVTKNDPMLQTYIAYLYMECLYAKGIAPSDKNCDEEMLKIKSAALNMVRMEATMQDKK